MARIVTADEKSLKDVIFLDVNVRRDNFGRIVLDECTSDGEHLRDDGKFDEFNESGRQQCRQLLEESFAAFVGKRGHLRVKIEFEEQQ